MPNSYFQFKQFTIHQEKSAMKVGTDGVLMGAWAGVSGAKTILDVGTGTGLIALMLAQRSDAKVTGVEIEPAAGEQAFENAGRSPWNERIEIIRTSFQEFSKTQTQHFDLIVSNPPFFTDSLKNPSEERTLARHNDALSFEDFLECTDTLLSPGGSFAIILPYISSQLFMIDAALRKLYCNRKTSVLPASRKKPHRILMQFSRTRTPVHEEELVIRNESGEYTREYREMTKDFYLYF